MASEDSVEAFLAREQQQLAGIDEFGGNGIYQRMLNAFSNCFEFTDVGVQQEGPVNGFSNFESETMNGGEAHSTPTSAPITLSALPPQQQAAMRQEATPTPPPSLQREEPAKIKIWREQQKERLEKKGRENTRCPNLGRCPVQRLHLSSFAFCRCARGKGEAEMAGASQKRIGRLVQELSRTY